MSALFAEDVFIFLERERDKIALVGNTNSFAATLSYKRFSSKTSLYHSGLIHIEIVSEFHL